MTGLYQMTLNIERSILHHISLSQVVQKPREDHRKVRTKSNIGAVNAEDENITEQV
ncbi:hypothetical protein TorRG33x02_049890, partial [Trema orientale]